MTRVLLAVTIAHAYQARGSGYARQVAVLATLVLLQATLGIATLMMVVPLPLALCHQLGAVIVLSFAVVHLREMTPPHSRAVSVPA